MNSTVGALINYNCQVITPPYDAFLGLPMEKADILNGSNPIEFAGAIYIPERSFVDTKLIDSKRC